MPNLSKVIFQKLKIAKKELLNAFILLFSVAGDKITCGVAASSQQNVAQLTCYFPEDIGLTKKNIQVNRLTDNNGESWNSIVFLFLSSRVIHQFSQRQILLKISCDPLWR